MTDESKGGGGPTTPKVPVGTFLPWGAWPKGAEPTPPVGKEVSKDKNAARREAYKLGTIMKNTGFKLEEDGEGNLKLVIPEEISDQLLKNELAERAAKATLGEKTEASAAEITPNVQQQNTSSPERKRYGSKEYAVGETIKIKRKNSDKIEAAEIVSFLGNSDLKVRVRGVGIDAVHKVLTISPLQIYEESSLINQTSIERKNSPEQKFSRNPRAIDLKIYKPALGGNVGKWRLSKDGVSKNIETGGDLSTEELNKIKDLLKKYRVFITSGKPKVMYEKFSGLIHLKDELLNRLESGWFTFAKENELREFEFILNDDISTYQTEKESIGSTNKVSSSPTLQTSSKNPLDIPINKNIPDEVLRARVGSTLKKYRDFIANAGKAGVNARANEYSTLVNLKDSLINSIDKENISEIENELAKLEEELAKHTAVNTVRPASITTPVVTTSTPTTKPAQVLRANQAVPTPPSVPNQLGPTDLMNEVISNDKAFWGDKDTQTPEQKNKRVMIHSEFIDIMDQITRQPEYKYSVLLKKSSRTNEYYWDITVPERNFHTTKTALEKLKGIPRDWKRFLYSLRDRNPTEIEPKKEPTFPNDKITEDEWAGILLLLDDYKDIMTSVDVARAFPELIDLKNKMLTAVDNENYNIAKAKAKELKKEVAKATKILAGISSPNSTPDSGSASGNGGAGVPPSGSGGGASVPPPITPGGAGNAPAAPGQPRRKHSDVMSGWPMWISFDGQKGKKRWVLSLDPKNPIELKNTSAWSSEFENAKPVFDKYKRFIDEGSPKEKEKKWEICSDLIDLKNQVIECLKSQDLATASDLRENLRKLTEEWIVNWPKTYEKFVLEGDFKKQEQSVIGLTARAAVIKLGDVDTREVQEFTEILKEYGELIHIIPADKKLSNEDKNLYQAYKEIFDSFKTKVLALEEIKRKEEGSRGSILHPLPAKRQWRRLVNGKIVFSPIQEWADQQNVKKEEEKQEKKASLLRTEVELRALHEDMFQRDPEIYLNIYDKKFDSNNIDSDDLEKKTVGFILGKYGHTLDDASREKVDALRAKLALEESTQIKTLESMPGASYTFVPTKKNMRKLDNQMRKNIDPATGKTKINPETNEPVTYNAGKAPGVVKMIDVPRTEVRLGRSPEESRLRAKRVNSMFGSLEKINLKNWKAWMAAGISGLGAVAYMGLAGASENPKTGSGIEATQSKERKIDWRESFNKTAEEVDKVFLENISDKNLNNLSLIKKYIPVSDHYPDTILNLDAHRLLYDNTSPDFEGTVDPSSKKSYRAEISKILKSGMGVASFANGGTEIKPNVEESVGDFLTRVKSMVIGSDKRNT